MKTKAIALMAVMALTFVGFFGAVADSDATDPAPTYLTIIYKGIIDPADLTVIGGSPVSANYVADVVAEPVSYMDGKKFEAIEPYIVGAKFVVPIFIGSGSAIPVADWTDSEKANKLSAFEQFAGPITTEVKFDAPANKTVIIASAADFEKELALALAIVEADYDGQLAEKDAKIAEQKAAIDAKDKAIKEKDDKIAALEAQISGEPVKDESQDVWMVIAILALVAAIALAGFIVYQTVKAKKEAKA